MRYIDMEKWARKEHFNFFNQLDYPHFSVSANLDISGFYHYIKKENLSFFKTLLFIVTKVANDIPELRLRIRGQSVVEHEMIHPNFTVLNTNNLFSFCPVKFTPDFYKFIKDVSSQMEIVSQMIYLHDDPERDDVIYVTSLPWVSFTGITHPIHLHPVDSIPRIAWGKFFTENEMIKLPFSIQVHHALLDGFHVGQYFEKLQRSLDEVEKILL